MSHESDQYIAGLEARVRELDHQWGAASAALVQSEARVRELKSELATETALLMRCYQWLDDNEQTDDPYEDLAAWRKEILAGQPAEPTRTPELRPGCTTPDYYEPAAPTRTEAVLDAMGSVSEGWLRSQVAHAIEAAVVLSCQAELARRGLK